MIKINNKLLFFKFIYFCIGCFSMLKNKEGKIFRLLVKDNEYKDVLKECRKVEK